MALMTDFFDEQGLAPKATFAQRVKWHLEHAKHCACRPMPAELLERVKAGGIEISKWVAGVFGISA